MNFFLDFSLELQKASSLNEQEAMLSRVLTSLGFGSFLYALIPSSQNQYPEEFVACTNFDEQWLTHYDEANMFANDYAAHHCISKSGPLLWSQMFDKIDDGTLDKRFKNTADATRDWDFTNGLSIPIPHFGSSSAALSIVIKNNIKTKEANQEFQRNLNSLTLIANAFHANVDHFSISQRHFDISQREIEVLKWLSNGYSTKQIAFKTKRSTHTVNKQIQSAKSRLKCATTFQAVARAVKLAII